jgi:hypothetical protein
MRRGLVGFDCFREVDADCDHRLAAKGEDRLLSQCVSHDFLRIDWAATDDDDGGSAGCPHPE